MFFQLISCFGIVASLTPGVIEQAVGADAASATSSTEDELVELDMEVEAAVVRGDVGFLDRVLSEDFRFPHGDAWTSGGQPTLVDTKTTWLAAVKNRRTPFVAREVTLQQAEVHGDVALTTGKIHVRTGSADPKRQEYTVWFLRTYAKREGRWQLLSHRTVRETFGPE